MKVSIPQGTIKRVTINDVAPYSLVSIPQGTIKRDYEFEEDGEEREFQFHKVRLKDVRERVYDEVQRFQFHKVRLKGVKI